MDPEDQTEQIEALQQHFTGLLGMAETFLRSMLQPWRLYQIAIVVALFASTFFAMIAAGLTFRLVARFTCGEEDKP